MLLQLLDALSHAHARGVVHRDLKSANVLFCASTGMLKLTDFGLARELDRDRTQGLVVGSPATMAPEQFMGGLITFANQAGDLAAQAGQHRRAR